MTKKEFMNGLYPEKEFRAQRLEEVKKELDVMVLQREYLSKEINKLLFEAQMLDQMDKLESFVNGEINIEIKDKEE